MNKQELDSLITRIYALKPGQPALWGKMDVVQMFSHCTAGFRMALGDIELKQITSPLMAAFARLVFLKWLPFKRELPTAPELNAYKKLSSSGDFETERAALIYQLDRFFKTPKHHKFGRHPIFGKMSKKGWDLLAYKHTDHHLKQFGV